MLQQAVQRFVVLQQAALLQMVGNSDDCGAANGISKVCDAATGSLEVCGAATGSSDDCDSANWQFR